jgi:hypothetical protein
MARRVSGLSQQASADAVSISVRSAQRVDRVNCKPALTCYAWRDSD